MFVALTKASFVGDTSRRGRVGGDVRVVGVRLRRGLGDVGRTRTTCLGRVGFFQLLVRGRSSLRAVGTSVLRGGTGTPFTCRGYRCSRSTLRMLGDSTLVRRVPSGRFVLGLLRTCGKYEGVGRSGGSCCGCGRSRVAHCLSRRAAGGVRGGCGDVCRM